MKKDVSVQDLRDIIEAQRSIVIELTKTIQALTETINDLRRPAYLNPLPVSFPFPNTAPTLNPLTPVQPFTTGDPIPFPGSQIICGSNVGSANGGEPML